MSKQAQVLVADALAKHYREGKNSLTIFEHLELVLKAGETLAIMGRSGAGKTTLLNILGGLDSPSEGQVVLNGEQIHALSERKRARLRNNELGFVYQFHHLLPEFSALENVCMPLLIGGEGRKSAAKGEALLQQVGLAERVHHKPAELSGGERQRVAIARALIRNPSVVLMDEPTGNLDEETATQVQKILWRLAAEHNTAFIIATHDERLAASAERLVRLEQGRLLAPS